MYHSRCHLVGISRHPFPLWALQVPSARVPGLNLPAWKCSALWSCFSEVPCCPCGPQGTEPLAQETAACDLTTGSAALDLMRGSPDFKLLFFVVSSESPSPSTQGSGLE